MPATNAKTESGGFSAAEHAAMRYAQGLGLVAAGTGALPSIGEGLAESHRDQSFYQRHRKRLAGAESQRA